MELEKIRDFFESFYKCIHLLDEEIYDKDVLQNIMGCMEEKLRFIADHFCEEGILKQEFSGRVLFVYQNSSMFCKLFLIEALKKKYKENQTYMDMRFLTFDIDKAYKESSEIFEEYKGRIKEKCQIEL